MASGIVSIWTGEPGDVGPAVAALEDRFPGRFLLGIGTSHGPIVADYSRPYSKMVDYLNALDALATPVSPERRVLAALGPRMLELAAARSVGAHPYFVPVEHTARAREIMGPGPLLAPEVAVVLETDPARARELARGYAATYLQLPNYTENLRSFGFGDDDIGGGGSDRLIDAVIPWGDAALHRGGRDRPSGSGGGPCLPAGRGRSRRGLPAAGVPGAGNDAPRSLRWRPPFSGIPGPTPPPGASAR